MIILVMIIIEIYSNFKLVFIFKFCESVPKNERGDIKGS